MPRFLYHFGYVLMPVLPFAFVFALIFSIKFLLEDDKNFLYFAIAASIFLLLILCGRWSLLYSRTAQARPPNRRLACFLLPPLASDPVFYI